jgi:hypothetical protein
MFLPNARQLLVFVFFDALNRAIERRAPSRRRGEVGYTEASPPPAGVEADGSGSFFICVWSFGKKHVWSATSLLSIYDR